MEVAISPVEYSAPSGQGGRKVMGWIGGLYGEQYERKPVLIMLYSIMFSKKVICRRRGSASRNLFFYLRFRMKGEWTIILE